MYVSTYVFMCLVTCVLKQKWPGYKKCEANQKQHQLCACLQVTKIFDTR